MTELCGRLERYRSENQKIVQQKELQIQSLQSSLASSRERKASVYLRYIQSVIMYFLKNTGNTFSIVGV